MIGVVLAAHNFYFENAKFMLDGQELQILGGEMHPTRIPYQYWEHRILMSKAMGLNTISIYVFWNAHEMEDGSFDFSTPQNNLSEFARLCQKHDMYLLVRPGPFVCAEWDFGGIPSRFLKNQSVRIRSSYNQDYVFGYHAYLAELAKALKDYMIYNDGPILMISIENEYSIWYEQDQMYIDDIREVLIKNGLTGPFFSADNGWALTQVSHVKGGAIGLNGDPVGDADFAYAYKLDPTVPALITEVYPGWFRHWNESSYWTPKDIVDSVDYYVRNGTSFVLYVVHGGTNFGLTAGSNVGAGGIYPDLTSYDYGSPIAEQGNAGPNYYRYREVLQRAYRQPLIDVPASIPTMQVPNIKFARVGGLFDQTFITEEPSIRPLHFEYYGQNYGVGVYSATLPVGQAGKLEFQNVHDYVQIYVNGKYVAAQSRQESSKFVFDLPVVEAPGKLEVLCEAFGHMNVDSAMQTDWKGVFDHVWFNGELVSSWTLNRLPLQDFAGKIVEKDEQSYRHGGIFKAVIDLAEAKDMFLDFMNYQKGYVFVNGHNLGRYWNVGPQQRLYCPGVWLSKGKNTIYVVDFEAQQPFAMTGFELGLGCPEGQELKGGYCQ